MKRISRAAANADILRKIKSGEIKTKEPLTLDKPRRKEAYRSATANDARRAAILEMQAASFADPKPRPGSAGMGIICKTKERKIAGEMNALEAAFAARLESRKISGLILDYLYEEHRLKVGVGSWYTPDFFVTLPDARVYLVEVKPFRYDDDTGKVIKIANEDAIAKLKGCLLRHPFPILWALGRKLKKEEGSGYEWIEEWAGDIEP